MESDDVSMPIPDGSDGGGGGGAGRMQSGESWMRDARDPGQLVVCESVVSAQDLWRKFVEELEGKWTACRI